MSRGTPPDHTAPGAFAGLTMRLRRRATLPSVDLGEGRRQFNVTEEAARLRDLSLADLEQEAESLELDLTVRPLGDRADSLRRRILERKLSVSLGGEA